jgi:RNA polymerase-binding transcription factor DksA
MAPTKSTRSTAKAAAAPPRRPVKAQVKTAVKPAIKPAVKHRSPLTKKELDELRERLQSEKLELEEQLTTLEENTFAASQSDISGEVAFDDETADAGTATFERERDLSIENNVRDLLAKIDRAMRRMDAGTYGLCDRCGKPIEKARIKALPYVDLCIKDAQAQSRR